MTDFVEDEEELELEISNCISHPLFSNGSGYFRLNGNSSYKTNTLTPQVCSYDNRYSTDKSASSSNLNLHAYASGFDVAFNVNVASVSLSAYYQSTDFSFKIIFYKMKINNNKMDNEVLFVSDEIFAPKSSKDKKYFQYDFLIYNSRNIKSLNKGEKFGMAIERTDNSSSKKYIRFISGYVSLFEQ